MGDGVQFALGVARQVRALGQILAQQAIGVLISAALPGTVRIGKEDLDREPLGQLLVLGHLFAPIIVQGFSQRSRDMPKFLRETLAGTPRIRPIARPFDEVAFPVAGHRTGGHLDGTLGNRRDVGDLAVAVCALRA